MHYFCKSAIILITYLLLATTLKAAEGGGHTVGNGGDLSELYIIEIWLNLDKKIEYCFESTDPCQLLATEKNEIKFLLNHF